MSDRRALLRRAAPLGLLAVLAVALVVRLDDWPGTPVADASAADRLAGVLDRLPEDPLILVGFDPDLGTYAETRPTVRVVLAELLRRDATLAIVSLTPEGRALAVSELERLRRADVRPDRIVDLGFLPGAEAALVRIARTVGGQGEVTDEAVGWLSAMVELGAVDLGVVVGGNDMGPRSWVEQVLPRTVDLELVAVAPTVLLPELQPYVGSGQLAALIATIPDGAAFRAGVDLGSLSALADPFERPVLPLLLGVVVAVGVLGQALGSRLGQAVRTARSREQP